MPLSGSSTTSRRTDLAFPPQPSRQITPSSFLLSFQPTSICPDHLIPPYLTHLLTPARAKLLSSSQSGRIYLQYHRHPSNARPRLQITNRYIIATCRPIVAQMCTTLVYAIRLQNIHVTRGFWSVCNLRCHLCRNDTQFLCFCCFQTRVASKACDFGSSLRPWPWLRWPCTWPSCWALDHTIIA